MRGTGVAAWNEGKDPEVVDQARMVEGGRSVHVLPRFRVGAGLSPPKSWPKN